MSFRRYWSKAFIRLQLTPSRCVSIGLQARKGDTSLPIVRKPPETEILLADLVDDQLILVSDVKVAIDDHRMWPTLAIVCRKLELTQ